MLRKKMLTVACALGILACGACFLPPLPEPSPRRSAPPLPVQPRWYHIHSVRVIAADVSDSHYLDSEYLAMNLADRINWMARGYGIRAFASNQPANEDAVLEFKVEKESATPWTAQSTQKVTTWSFSIRTSASLRDRNGQVRWLDEEPAILFRAGFPQDPSIDIWKQGGFNESLPEFLGDRVAHLALYQP
ncbi:MAG: hypothetical protein ABSF28_04920 [Terracidiphilus sp.]|jgi:hypothetical protein